MDKRINRLFNNFGIAMLFFLLGTFYTYYKIDQRLWNETTQKAWDIEARALNFPQKSCYNWQDIELIIFGEIQE
ncbi:MAG: hypothetical protein HOF44_10390 [Pelagibacterales bacterium]|jgi:hypothetical protein|nr:hypothetical protein [Pelagibacterales bacterium]|tara:strand:- start:194 stop:415 length:222 start_codon:yes stop_codon:yes gene_type:complete